MKYFIFFKKKNFVQFVGLFDEVDYQSLDSSKPYNYELRQLFKNEDKKLINDTYETSGGVWFSIPEEKSDAAFATISTMDLERQIRESNPFSGRDNMYHFQICRDLINGKDVSIQLGKLLKKHPNYQLPKLEKKFVDWSNYEKFI